MALKLGRLWQPRRPLFWLMLGFNLLSSLLAWVMRTWPLTSFGLLLLGSLALANVAFGLLMVWRLLHTALPGEGTDEQR